MRRLSLRIALRPLSVLFLVAVAAAGVCFAAALALAVSPPFVFQDVGRSSAPPDAAGIEPDSAGVPLDSAGVPPDSAGALPDSFGTASVRTPASARPPALTGAASVRTPLSATATGDTAGAPPDTAATRTVKKIRHYHSWTRASLPGGAVVRGPAGMVLPRATAERSTEATLREVLEWSAALRRVPGAAYNAPDPVDAGDLPGREAPVYLIEGMPLAPSGYPETTPDPAGPVWLERISYQPADPLLLPSNPSGGPIVALELLRPDSSRAASGARLTSGTNGVYTEEFFLATPKGSQLTRFGYADSKTEGRFGDGTFRQFGENLLFRLDRGTAWGGWRFGWRQAKTRVRPTYMERYLHDRSSLEGGVALLQQAWAADLSVAMNWERLAWEGDVPATRKEALARGLLRIEGHGARWRPLLTLQLDRQRRRFDQGASPPISEDHTDLGPGLAGGIEGVSKSWQYRASAGWSTPAPGKSGWVAAATAERPLPGGWVLRLHADRCVRSALVPRLADDLADAVGQGAHLTGNHPGNDRQVVDPGRRLEAPGRVEAGLEGGALRTRWMLLARGVRIDHAVAPGPGELPLFTPEGYAHLSAASLDRTVEAASLRCAATVDLGRGMAFEIEGTGRTARPAVDDQLWMTPWDARARLSLRRVFFSGDLQAEGFLRGAISGPRSAPYGRLRSADRYDAGVAVQVEDLSLFAVFLNLENDLTPAADYEPAGLAGPDWVPLPLRGYRMGLTWRFLD